MRLQLCFSDRCRNVDLIKLFTALRECITCAGVNRVSSRLSSRFNVAGNSENYGVRVAGFRSAMKNGRSRPKQHSGRRHIYHQTHSGLRQQLS